VKTETEEGHHLWRDLVFGKAGAQQKQTYPSLAGSRTERDFQRLGDSKISTEKPGPGRKENHRRGGK
jgi:hypothetical protein